MQSTAKTEALGLAESAVDGNTDDMNGEEKADEEEEEDEAGDGMGDSLTLDDIIAMKPVRIQVSCLLSFFADFYV